MRSQLCRSILCSLLLVPAFAIAQEAVPAGADAPAIDAAATVTAEAGAPTAVANPLVGPAPSDKGQIVFFRESKFTGAAIGFKVREGDVELGKLRSGKYFVVTVEPGIHEYTVHSETKDVLTMEIEPGETYYVQGSLSMGAFTGRPNLAPSDEATFLGMSKKLKLAQ